MPTSLESRIDALEARIRPSGGEGLAADVAAELGLPEDDPFVASTVNAVARAAVLAGPMGEAAQRRAMEDALEAARAGLKPTTLAV